MRFPVVVNPHFERMGQLDMALETLNANQNVFYFPKVTSDRVPRPHREHPISPMIERSAIVESIECGNRAAIVTGCRFDDNWFSHTSSSGTIITTFGWDDIFQPPSLSTYLQMELIAHSIAQCADLTESAMNRMAHQRSEACLFDFCMNKTDVRFKIVAGHLCPTCQGHLKRLSIGEPELAAVQRLLDIMRLDSIGSLTRTKIDQVFTVMPFVENDDTANAYRYALKPSFEKFGITSIRADDVPGDGSLVKKIFRLIDESWGVAIFAANDNANVFLEFGYSIAKCKPLFVIMSHDKIVHAPSDIRGLEYIGYSAGDFEGLRRRIEQRLQAFPRFGNRS